MGDGSTATRPGTARSAPCSSPPSTWARWAADGNRDGVKDPQQIDDAALAAARYLCNAGTMATPEGWRAAVLTYNNSNAYADQVATVATEYARRVQS